MSVYIKKPILVTGAFRSGTTWVGRMLSLAPGVAYIHEPFHPGNSLGVNQVNPKPFEYGYKYLNHHSVHNYSFTYQNILNYEYPLVTSIRRIKNLQDCARVIRNQTRCNFYKICRKRPLVKDPLALFSAEWLYQNFDMDIVIMIRHPAAFCSSIKLKNWRGIIQPLLKQPELIEKYLSHYEYEINSVADYRVPALEKAIVFWKCIYSTVYLYLQQYPKWHFIRHEDISMDVLSEYRRLYKNLNLNYTSKVEQQITKNSGKHNPTESDPKNEFKRNSLENVKNWKNRLSEKEIKFIKSETVMESKIFYSEDSWV